MNIKEAYQTMQAECGIEPGDKVKVVREFGKNEMGSRCGKWNNFKEKAGMQGRTVTVDYFGSGYINVLCGSAAHPGRVYEFPFFALELVEKKPAEKMVDVDGKKISLSTVQEALRNHIG